MIPRKENRYARFIFFIFGTLWKVALGADLVIQIPGNPSQEGSLYRLDYSPPYGNPPPNSTFASKDIGDSIQFSQGLPGTKYDFKLYYTNSTYNDLLTWTASITTTPDPPSNLSVYVRSGDVAQVVWSAPKQGGYSGFKLKVVPLPEARSSVRTLQVGANDSPYMLQHLTPGASYQIQLSTVYENKESIAYTSRNFTTKPNTPGKFIVWFRNETTLLVLWQPPYPPGIFTYYKVSIDPADALESVLYVGNEGEPPGPAQAAFKGLVPGRAYNISVQTMSEDEVSVPTTAQYRTVPERPVNITFDKASITSNSFKVQWEAPQGKSEFDKYQISLNGMRRPAVIRGKDKPNVLEFRDGLEPGRSYQVSVKTMSGKVASWPISANVTLKPLSVSALHSNKDEKTGNVIVSWEPNSYSHQDSYKLSYHEVETYVGDRDTNSMIIEGTSVALESLLPGRNYSITVQAVSNHVESNGSSIYQATSPSSPIIEDLRPTHNGLNISWKSDVNSKQEKYEVTYSRNDTGESVSILTTESRLVIEDLRSGAGYQLQVVAISHGLRSEPHTYFQAVYPQPPRNLSIEKATNNFAIIKWLPPIDSIFTEFAVKYKIVGEDRWFKLALVRDNKANVTDMVPGEKYVIQVNTVSFGVESTEHLEVTQTIRPNPVSNIAPLVDSTNVTLEWPRPEGRIDKYFVSWQPDEPEEVEDEDEDSEKHTGGFGNKTIDGDTPVVDGRVRVLIGDLMPGAKYLFKIFTTSHKLMSDITQLTTRTMPLIQTDLLVVNDQSVTDALTLRYTRTPQSVSKFDLYRFMLSDPSIPVKEKAANDTETKVTFTGLMPGRLYNITVWTISDGVASQPLHRQDRLYPEPITAINSTSIRETEVVLTWDSPKGEHNTYEVQYLNTEGSLIHNLTLDNTITVTGLKPHRNYTFTVVVRSGSESSVLRHSLPVSASFSTIESVPGKVEKFHPIDIQPKEITFEWALPSNEQNGVIVKYSITYGLEGSTHTDVRNFNPWDRQGVIKKGLIPGKSYVFRIQAETRVGYGPETIWKQKMPILAPPKPSSQVVPTEVRRTSTTIQIRFRKNYFSEQHGEVISYAIIVAEDDSKNSSGLEMPSWRDVQAYSLWPPYQIMEPYNPFKNSTVENFTIGADNCEGKLGYCNGPLKPGTTYKVKVRAFTAVDKFTDTFYSFAIQTDTDNTALIVGLTVPLIILFLLVMIVLAVRRKRVGACSKDMEARGNDSLSLPDSVMEISRPVKLKDFAEHYRIMSADSDFRFSEEFEELKHVGREQACTAADLPMNRPKNRFTNILPYDHSRFKLQPADDDEDGSDYINANYVPGFNSPREFIVTQGPLHSTRDDFWRTCWESNSRAIVMLTRCVEKGREKCDHYWPYDTQPVYYGDIQVTILNESHYPDWNVSEFRICRGDTTRIIRHFHFTTWPDFGVPDPPQTLVRFVRAFRERVGTEQRPIVVHCSAGVGRSGTFIALDRILQQLKQEDTVDIFGIVYAMRKERVWMVQTEQQYICIHQCLLTVLEGKENELVPREIHENEGFDDDEGIAESGM